MGKGKTLLIICISTAVIVCAAFAVFSVLGEGDSSQEKVCDMGIPEYPAEIIAEADRIGNMKLLPIDDYWNERLSASCEDEKEGYHSGTSFPGRRRVGSVSITNRKWRPDTSKYGPHLKACEEKWSPVIERNFEIGECRASAIKNLRHCLERCQGGINAKSFSDLCSNIVERAHLSQAEAEYVFAGFKDCQGKNHDPNPKKLP